MNRSSLFFVLGSLLAGCGANATGSPGTSSNDPPPAPASNAPSTAPTAVAHAGTLLATASTKDGRKVSFYELSPGTVVVEQSGPVGTKPL
ncbi:MAG TPA: hypothetical protein VIY73_12685, partial [Polyangiaceae bacterium]